jgi:protein involved in polysaccharide export with SLBB domain
LRAACWLLVLVETGCVANQGPMNQALLTNRPGSATQSAARDQYCVRCPDILEVEAAGRPDLAVKQAVDVAGRLDLGELGERGPLRVEGRTTVEIADLIAATARVPREKVRVSVARYASQQIYLFGKGIGVQRAVAYQGPETVLEVLQRVGGITTGAAPNDVFVIRSRLTEGQTPEVFRVDLHAVLHGNDQKTNMRLQPFDQIYVGETRQSSLVKCIPPCLQPVYKAFWGLF